MCQEQKLVVDPVTDAVRRLTDTNAIKTQLRQYAAGGITSLHRRLRNDAEPQHAADRSQPFGSVSICSSAAADAECSADRKMEKQWSLL